MVLGGSFCMLSTNPSSQLVSACQESLEVIEGGIFGLRRRAAGLARTGHEPQPCPVMSCLEQGEIGEEHGLE